MRKLAVALVVLAGCSVPDTSPPTPPVCADGEKCDAPAAAPAGDELCEHRVVRYRAGQPSPATLVGAQERSGGELVAWRRYGSDGKLEGTTAYEYEGGRRSRKVVRDLVAGTSTIHSYDYDAAGRLARETLRSAAGVLLEAYSLDYTTSGSQLVLDAVHERGGTTVAEWREIWEGDHILSKSGAAYVITYSYSADSRNVLEQAVELDHETGDEWKITYTHDRDGQLQRKVLTANGVLTKQIDVAYGPGERVWLHRPAGGSQQSYAERLDARGRVIERQIAEGLELVEVHTYSGCYEDPWGQDAASRIDQHDPR